MKTWNVPAVEELNVELTAGGFFPCKRETCLTHGHSCPPSCPTQPDPEDKTDPTPDEES